MNLVYFFSLLLALSGAIAHATVVENPDASIEIAEGWGGVKNVMNIQESTDGSEVFFSHPVSPLKVKAFQLKNLGVLRSEKAATPYFLFKGKECSDCKDANRLYLSRADGNYHTQFTFPGTVKHKKSGRTLFIGRAFFGKCVWRRGEVFVVFQKEKVDRRRYLQHSVFIAELKNDKVQESILVRRRPRLKDTLKRVRRKTCTEIKGTNRLASRR